MLYVKLDGDYIKAEDISVAEIARGNGEYWIELSTSAKVSGGYKHIRSNKYDNRSEVQYRLDKLVEKLSSSYLNTDGIIEA